MYTQNIETHAANLDKYATVDAALKACNVEAEIDAIFKDFKKVRDGLQAVLIYTMLHIEKYKDTRYIGYIVRKFEDKESDAKGINREAIIEWINVFTKADVEYDKEAKKHKVTFDAKKANNIEEAKTTKWWTFKDKKDMTGYKADDAVDNLIGLHNKKAAEKKKYETNNQADKAAKIDLDSDLMNVIKLLKSNRNLIALVNAEHAKLIAKPVAA